MLSGVVSAEGLRRMGWTSTDLASALDTGALRRIAKGWFASTMADSWAVAAIRHGGRLGCLSGCRLHGLWTPQHNEPHILIDRGAARKHSAWHRHPGRFPADAVFSLEDCLAQVIGHHGAEEALTVLESASNQQRITRSTAELLIGAASGRKQRALKWFEPRAESGSETRVRLWLRQRGFKVRAQVVIPGVGRVDLVVGESLILECDSREFHPFSEEDFRRDMVARALGYTPVRITYQQIFTQWEETQEYLLRLLRTGAHLRPPRPH